MKPISNFWSPSEVVALSPAERLAIPVARLERAAPLKVGPQVRIRLPPARSPLRTCPTPHRVRPLPVGMVCTDRAECTASAASSGIVLVLRPAHLRKRRFSVSRLTPRKRERSHIGRYRRSRPNRELRLKRSPSHSLLARAAIGSGAGCERSAGSPSRRERLNNQVVPFR